MPAARQALPKVRPSTRATNKATDPGAQVAADD